MGEAIQFSSSFMEYLDPDLPTPLQLDKLLAGLQASRKAQAEGTLEDPEVLTETLVLISDILKTDYVPAGVYLMLMLVMGETYEQLEDYEKAMLKYEDGVLAGNSVSDEEMLPDQGGCLGRLRLRVARLIQKSVDQRVLSKKYDLYEVLKAYLEAGAPLYKFGAPEEFYKYMVDVFQVVKSLPAEFDCGDLIPAQLAFFEESPHVAFRTPITLEACRVLHERKAFGVLQKVCEKQQTRAESTFLPEKAQILEYLVLVYLQSNDPVKALGVWENSQKLGIQEGFSELLAETGASLKLLAERATQG